VTTQLQLINIIIIIIIIIVILLLLLLLLLLLYIGARNDTTQHSWQTPDKELEIKNSTAYVKGHTEKPDSPGRKHSSR
jgi:uncharacterized membrane protein YqiK